MKQKKILELFSNDKNKEFCSGLFFTYTFQPEFFETEILSLFYKTSCNPIEDSKGFISELNTYLIEKPVTVIMDEDNYMGGKSISYDLFTFKNRLFHPKLYILQFEDTLRVIIGSANMTEQGICKNVELITYFDIDETKGGEHAEDILNFILSVKSEVKRIGDAGENIVGLLEKYKKPRKEKYPQILSTYMEQSILENVFNLVEGSIESVTVMSPFYEKDVVTDKSIDKTVFGKLASKNINEFNLYMPGTWNSESGKWKVEAPKKIIKAIEENKNIKLNVNIIKNTWTVDKDKEQHRELHGKLLSIKTDKGVYTLMGSPNFTQAALYSNEKNKRNVELSILFYSKKVSTFLNYERLKIKDIEFVEPVIKNKEKIKIIEKAVIDLSEEKLIIDFSEGFEDVQVQIYLKEELVYSGTAEKQIVCTVENKELLLTQEIKVVCNDEEVFYPLEIEGKERIIELSEGIDFKLSLKDIIDFYAGKYKNLKQIANKRVVGYEIAAEDETKNGETYGDVASFRYDIRSFLRAVDALGENLNKRVWTEISFNTLLNSPFGINRFIELIDEAVSNKAIETEEVFFYYLNIYDMLKKLSFDENVGLAPDIKDKYKNEIMSSLKEKVNNIHRKERKKNVKQQYEIAMKMYLN